MSSDDSSDASDASDVSDSLTAPAPQSMIEGSVAQFADILRCPLHDVPNLHYLGTLSETRTRGGYYKSSVKMQPADARALVGTIILGEVSPITPISYAKQVTWVGYVVKCSSRSATVFILACKDFKHQSQSYRKRAPLEIHQHGFTPAFFYSYEYSEADLALAKKLYAATSAAPAPRPKKKAKHAHTKKSNY